MKFKPYLPWLIPVIILGILLSGIGLCAHFAEKYNTDKKKGLPDSFHRFDRYIQQSCDKHMPNGWDWQILKAMIRKESTFNPKIRSAGGAVGLCQLLPRTAKDMGLSSGSFFSPGPNINAGARYLRQLWDHWRSVPQGPPHWQRTRFAIASYNAGLGRVLEAQRSCGGSSRWERIQEHIPSSTKLHVNTILNKYYPQFCNGGESHGPVHAFTARNSLRFWVHKNEYHGNRSR